MAYTLKTTFSDFHVLFYNYIHIMLGVKNKLAIIHIYIYIYMNKTNVVLIIVCNVSCYEKKMVKLSF